MNSPLPAEVVSSAAEWFARLQEDDASERDFQQWQHWLNAAPDHQRAYRDIERAWRLIGETKVETQVTKKRRPMRWALAATIAIVVAVPVAIYVGTGHGVRHSTATAEQRSLRLPDGSRVTLGASSTLESRFDGAERRLVLVRGEAFFDVARDPVRPFTVTAGASEIRAVGTAFNVRASSDRILVSVTEGRVEISSPYSSGSLLSAGEEIALAPGGPIGKKAPTATDPTTWLQGRFEYRGEELRHVVEDINRYTERRIILTDAALGALRYSGTVFPDHLDEWLEGISGALPVVVRENGSRREISAAP